MSSVDFLGAAPWVVITAIVTWFGNMWVYRSKRADDLVARQTDHSERMDIHRDELALQLLANARQEMSSARVEVEDLREEIRKLRAMETHFFHFQQSLEHLEALLFADSVDARANAERNARAFLTRMRRLNEAKGTIANEAQRVASEVQYLDRGTGPEPKKGK
jgi:hypothetical protein